MSRGAQRCIISSKPRYTTAAFDRYVAKDMCHGMLNQLRNVRANVPTRTGVLDRVHLQYTRDYIPFYATVQEKAGPLHFDRCIGTTIEDHLNHKGILQSSRRITDYFHYLIRRVLLLVNNDLGGEGIQLSRVRIS